MWVYLNFSIIFYSFVAVLCSKSENLLVKKLLNNYSSRIRPTEVWEKPTKVFIGMELLKIINVDEKNEMFEVNAWVYYQWNDPNLRWEPKNYENITETPLPAESVWRPDVLLYNSAASPNVGYPSNAKISFDGTVNWEPPAILKAKCKIDVTAFPFDDQHCYLKFGSWTYHGFAIDLQPNQRGIATTQLIPHGEWHLIEMTVLFAIYMFLKVVSEMTPATSDSVPLLGVFFCCLLFLTATSVVFSVFVLNMYFHKAKYCKKMHPAVKRILLKWLPPIIRMKRPVCLKASTKHVRKRRMSSFMDKETSTRVLKSVKILEDDKFAKQKTCTKKHLRRRLSHRIEDCLQPFLNGNPNENLGYAPTVHILWEIHSKLRKMTQKILSKEQKSKVEKEWRFAARVVDRICLILFSVSLTVTVVSVFIAAPHITL